MRRSYFERDRATALAVYDANGGNVFRTSNATGVPQSTLRDWVREPERAASQMVRLEEKRVLREILESIAVRCALALDTDLVVERLARRPQQLAVVLGIVVDKLHLMGSIPKDPNKMTITQLYAAPPKPWTPRPTSQRGGPSFPPGAC